MKIKPQNFEEKVVWYSIIGTYGLYSLGLLYMGIPLLGWFLVLYLWIKLLNQTEDTPEEEQITIPAAVWIWVASMLVMEFSVIMSHIDLDLGLDRIIKSSIGWARTWALMALFPLVGCLKIRPQLIYRAVCILCVQSLGFSLLCYLFYILHTKGISYVSPLGHISEKIANNVNLFIVDEDTKEFRLNLFTDFANSLGIVGTVYFFLAGREYNKKLRWIAMISAVVMVVGSFSRMTTFCLVIIPIITWILTNFTWPLQIAAGVGSLLAGMLAPLIIDFVDTTYDETINGYRSGSARVRKQLKKIALDRWGEYPLWGHGIVEERGPQTTGGVPIGTHNQWPDILYVKGMVGFVAFLFPLLWTFIDLLFKAQKNATAKVALSIILLLFIGSAGADLEAATYNYWPGLVVIGIGLKEQIPVVTTNKEYAPM